MSLTRKQKQRGKQVRPMSSKPPLKKPMNMMMIPDREEEEDAMIEMGEIVGKKRGGGIVR